MYIFQWELNKTKQNKTKHKNGSKGKKVMGNFFFFFFLLILVYQNCEFQNFSQYFDSKYRNSQLFRQFFEFQFFER